ncbi:hypothetical protein EON65_13790 [archaeon]|nr:MAG: hypothetical protein EON65_13790 [archaeon]
MATVLGSEIATEHVLQSWAEAYQQLARIFITAEENTYLSLEQRVEKFHGVCCRQERKRVTRSNGHHVHISHPPRSAPHLISSAWTIYCHEDMY